MAKGKLLIVGSVDFIKNEFGIGFHLSINIGEKSKEFEE